VEAARERLGRTHGLRSFLFIAEVIGFNSAQQDACCPGWRTARVTPDWRHTKTPASR